MRRREFIVLLGCTACGWSAAGRAQQSEQMRRIAVLTIFAENDPEGQARANALQQKLQDLGWTDGRNVRFEYRRVVDPDRIPAFAAELVRLTPDVILAYGSPALAALRRENSLDTIIVRRLKGSNDSTHYLERDELAALKALQRHYAKQSIKSAWVFVNERGEPFGRMGIARMIERAGETAKLAFPVHVHMVRHSTGYALANRGMDTRRLQHFLGHASITNTVRYTAMSPEPFKDIWR